MSNGGDAVAAAAPRSTEARAVERAPSRSASLPTLRFDFDGRRMINALTLLWLACLIPRHPFGADLPFVVALFAFMTVALVNHLFPTELPALTHVVKALYSFLLIDSVRADVRWAVPVMIADLLPLASARLALFEPLGAACRLVFIGVGFYQVGWSPGLWAFYGVTSAVYFFERRARIRRGRRSDYGWFHHFEHLAVVAWLFAVNREILDVHATWVRLAVAPVIVFSLLIILGVAINRSLSRRAREHGALPDWFDARIERELRAKLAANAGSTKLYNYFFKPFDHALSLRRVTWEEIEALVESTPLREPIDEVIGVLSGGAFVAACVARRNGIARLSYVRSSYWSSNDLPAMVVKIIRALRDEPVTSNLEVPPDLDVEGKVVLIVDDTVCTGATLNSITLELYRRRAKRVVQFTLYCNPAANVDYACALGPAPLIWPWGWEAD